MLDLVQRAADNNWRQVGKKVKSGTYEFSGTTQLKFSDFNMKPPTAMLGVMKVGNVITLSYKVEFVGDDVI